MTKYLVGIDLGTTNSALAYVDLRKSGSGKPKIQPFAIPQLVAAAEVGEKKLLPSFLYLPSEHDLPPGAVALPWKGEMDYAVGEFARNHGAKIAGRTVNSAKSWLCHSGVDRTAELLPWNGAPEVPRISPVEASARYLQHFVAAWNHTIGQRGAEHFLEKQKIVLTVPASFDDVARNLTVDAAKKAGLQDFLLLEEPQAAFYCWLATHSTAEAAALKPGWHCLVVDVGGGTTDFSLIQSGEFKGELRFSREAVGEHLLLGGDNMDLTLAKFVEQKLPSAGKLDAVQFGMLTQACRQAKESLLSEDPPDQETVTVMGRGRKVIGGSLHTTLTPREISEVIVNGFFPQVAANDMPSRAGKLGLHEMGLPYVSDPAITRHLAAFLQRQDSTTHEKIIPKAILFNGGVFQPQILRQRVIDVLSKWYGSESEPWQPLILSNPSLELAVAIGATHYCWLKHTGGQRIGGGIARSYYLAVGNPSDSQDDQQTVLCVVPQHLSEGEDVHLPKPELHLSLGQPVAFPLFTSTVRDSDHPGDVLTVEKDQLFELPPLHTVLRGGKRSGVKDVPVTLAAKVTEIGTVEIWCEAVHGDNRWRLEFNVRDIVKDATQTKSEASNDQTNVIDVFPEEVVTKAGRLIQECFQQVGPESPDPKEVTKQLELELESSRDNWPMGLCRRLWDFLMECESGRKHSLQHLNRWYNLVGFCLRPGFGDSLDKFRVEQLWKLLNAPKNLSTGSKSASRLPEINAQYWILWRRVAGGLNAPLQRTLFSRLRPILLAGKGKNVPKPPINELAEMWRAAASLERLDIKTREALGTQLLKQLRRSPTPTHGFPSLARLGARTLSYGPLNSIVHPHTAEQWIEAIASFTPGNESELNNWSFCLAQLARKTDQRALDISDSYRMTVLTVLKDLPIPERWVQMVEETVELESSDQGKLFGDSLPIGLKLTKEMTVDGQENE